MKHIPCFSWIPYGVAASNPTRIVITQREVEAIRHEKKDENSPSKNINSTTKIESDSLNSDDSLDQYSSHEKSNLEYSEGSDSSDQDIGILTTDNLLVFPVIEDDFMFNLQVDVFTGDISEPPFCHHDYILQDYPLCMSKLNISDGNFIAVGGRCGNIAVWDIDIINSIEPQLILGKKSKNGKNIKNIKRPRFGHDLAVLSLDSNTAYPNIVCSSSIDNSVILWDMDSKYNTPFGEIQQQDSVACVKWVQDSMLLYTGCDDGNFTMYDVKSSKKKLKQIKLSKITNAGKSFLNLSGPVETIKPSQFDKNVVYCSVGTAVSKIDIRNFSKVVWTLDTQHEQLVSCIEELSSRKDLVVTASHDGFIKIWDCEKETNKLMFSQDVQVGRISQFEESPDVNYLCAVSGDTMYKLYDVLKYIEV